MILAGDIGGTKVNLALYELEKDEMKMLSSQQFVSKDYEEFSQIIEEFKKSNLFLEVDALCLGIAGPIINQRCKTTNLPWDIKADDLKKQLNTKEVKLLNDLEATAYGMLYLKEDEFVSLNPKAKKAKGNIAVIAAGTGLGEAILFFDGNSYFPIGTEGGHSDFAATSSKQDELLCWLRKKYPEHVSYERVVSGAGIFTLYEFLLESGFAKEPQSMRDINENDDKNAMISHCALNENDPLCLETLRLFAEIYGAEAGNLALKCMSLGGVYIGGGIAPKILPMIKSDDFLNAFFNKGRFEQMLRSLEIKVSLNEKTALLGAARYAFDKLSKLS